MSSSASLIELLKSCGLENRAKLFEDEGYTLDVAKTAVRDDQATLLDDLRELKLPMDECRTFMEALAAADNAERLAAAAEADAAAKKKAEADAAAKKAEADAAAKKKAEASASASNQPQPEPKPVATAAVSIDLPVEPVAAATAAAAAVRGEAARARAAEERALAAEERARVAEEARSKAEAAAAAPPSIPPPSVAVGPPSGQQPPSIGTLTPGWTGTTGDRRTNHNGATKIQNPGMIRISDWELRGPGCCDKCRLALQCSWWDTTRSYLYVRDNHSIEHNDANGIKNCCTCCCFSQADDVWVTYSDRAPYAKHCKPSPFPCCCFLNCAQPKLEVIDLGFMCCCIKCNTCCCCCESKRVVIMPFEKFPFPCCCCSNRVSRCDNWCGCCGPVTGNPKIYGLFAPQPKDAEAFVAASQQLMMRH